MVEETIILQEENDLIDTPLGRANISDGVHTHNHMTLIWDVADADRIAHTPRLLTQGKATITQTSTATTFKLEDDSNQLAYTHDLKLRTKGARKDTQQWRKNKKKEKS
jgi:hypothetical protein